VSFLLFCVLGVFVPCGPSGLLLNEFAPGWVPEISCGSRTAFGGAAPEPLTLQPRGTRFAGRGELRGLASLPACRLRCRAFMKSIQSFGSAAKRPVGAAERLALV